MKIVTARQMRELENASVRAGVPLDTLMENAGLAVAEALRDRLPSSGSGPALVLIGPGNNGADGLVAARHLAARGVAVTAYLLTPRAAVDEKRDLAIDAGAVIVHAFDDEDHSKLAAATSEATVILDSVLGTGRGRPIEPPLSDLLRVVRDNARAPIVAVDVATGMATDTGHMDPNGLVASETLVLGRPKIGHFLEPTGAAWRCLEIGIPDGLDVQVPTELMTAGSMARIVPSRPARSNKGTFGRALIVAGSENYVGAAYLSGAAAGRAGAGLVTLALPDTIYPLIATRLAEATYIPLVEHGRNVIDSGFAAVQVTDASRVASAMLIGPGVGQTPSAIEFVRSVLLDRREGPRLVVDADALNALAPVDGWQGRVRDPAILTPHPGEMARLRGSTVPDVERDRVHSAQSAAETWRHIVVLKGACTVVAHPDGRTAISPWVNPGMATGGTGDVLAGLITGFLAQGMDPFDAASLGVYVHGLAGNIARRAVGEVALLAGDVLESLPPALKQLAN
ncbi:MAG: NAD(P)H-hydrate dehydratase [Dehalococcoidia bacterium]|nr:NAD(P)H-hydrate dehydratase [Dehalococcoidia bacterium]